MMVYSVVEKQRTVKGGGGILTVMRSLLVTDRENILYVFIFICGQSRKSEYAAPPQPLRDTNVDVLIGVDL
jgi:hypothetical protein